MSKVTEIIPDELPEWAEDAIAKGQFFKEAVQKVETLQAAIDDWCDNFNYDEYFRGEYDEKLFALRSKE